MPFAQASAFTSVTDIADRSSTGISSQRALSVEPYPKTIHQLSSHNPQPYHISANMPAVSPEEQQARLEAAYSSRPHAAAGSHGYPFLGDPGYPISSSAVGAHNGKKTTNPWPASNGPLSKCPYSPLSMFPCGSGKTPDRGDKVSTLKSWLYEHRKHPYPTKGEKVMLAVITKMTLTQVSTWFANARRRLKKDSKTTLPAIDRCKDNDDDDNDRNDDSNEVDEATRAPASSNIKSRKALFTHLSTDTEAEKITAPNESIVQDNEDYVGDENDICKHQTNEAVSVKTYQNSPFVADSTQDPECSLSSDRPLLVAMSDSHMPDKLSVGEKQRGGQSPLKIKCDRSGRDLEPQISSRLPSKVSPSGEKSSIRQVSSREVSSSTCGRPKIWSVTDFINTPSPSTKLTATSSLSTATATTTTTSTWYSSLPSASLWTSDSLGPLMTTAAMLPSAPPKSLPGQHHRSLSQGIIHWPPTAASSFARLTNSYQPRSLPYPHTTGRLAVPVSGQESSAAADGQSWPTLCLHSVYPMFPARVVFSPP